ncbi:MAG: OprO/OprP family phosphate-selective porin [Wenzhouxiangella sp.]
MLNKKPLVLAIGIGLSMVAVNVSALEINPRGRVHVDYAVHDEDNSELGDGFRARRARLGLSGKIDDDWAFQIEYDFAENSSSANDVYLRYTGWSAGNLTIGHFKVPFGLEEITSSNNISLIERSLPTTTFAQSRRMGIGYSHGGDNWTVAVMGFGQGQGSGVRSTTGDEGLGIGGRFTFNPIKTDSTLIHLGIAASTEQPEDSNLDQVRFRTRPESRPTNVRLVDTGAINDVSRINQLGLEAAWQSGPFSVQGEYMRADVSRSGGFSDVDFSGWYVSGSWVLTGESRGYRGGVFRGVTPTKPGGAWELTARVSNVNLDDGVVEGGEQDNWTIGVNWYANSRVRFMANYINVSTDRRGVSDDPGIFLMRAQVAF